MNVVLTAVKHLRKDIENPIKIVIPIYKSPYSPKITLNSSSSYDSILVSNKSLQNSNKRLKFLISENDICVQLFGSHGNPALYYNCINSLIRIWLIRTPNRECKSQRFLGVHINKALLYVRICCSGPY